MVLRLYRIVSKMATEPPPLFDDSDNEGDAADATVETAQAANLFDVDLTKEDTPEPVSKDPLLQPPPVEEETVKEDKPPVEPEPEPVKPKPQPSSFLDDSDSEAPPKEKPVAEKVTDDKPTDLHNAADVAGEQEKHAEEEEVMFLVFAIYLTVAKFWVLGRRGGGGRVRCRNLCNQPRESW